MKNKIQTRAELRLEIERLTAEQHLLENKIKADFQALAENLKPVNLIKNSIRAAAGDSELRNLVASKGVEALLGFIVSNLFLRKYNPIIRSVVSLFGTSVAMNFLGDDSSDTIEKIKKLFTKIREVFKKKDEESKVFNERDVYNN